MACLESIQHFFFHKLLVADSFPAHPQNNSETSRQNGCYYKKSKAGWLAACLDQASCFCLVRASKPIITQLTQHTLMTGLGSLLAWHLRACTRGLFLKSSGSQAQLRCKQHFGVIEKIFLLSMIGMQQYACLSLVVLGRLACGLPQNRPISYQKVLDENSSACRHSCLEKNNSSACQYSCRALVEDGL